MWHELTVAVLNVTRTFYGKAVSIECEEVMLQDDVLCDYSILTSGRYLRLLLYSSHRLSRLSIQKEIIVVPGKSLVLPESI